MFSYIMTVLVRFYLTHAALPSTLLNSPQLFLHYPSTSDHTSL
jgi:hypothetical protein